MTDWTDDPDAQDWLHHVRTELTPMLRDSAITAVIAPGPDPDPKIAVELGLTILLDKPLIIVVPPGVYVPDHLIRVADDVIEWTDDHAEMARRINAAAERLTL